MHLDKCTGTLAPSPSLFLQQIASLELVAAERCWWDCGGRTSGIISCCVLALPPNVSDAGSTFQGVLSKYGPESGAEAGPQLTRLCFRDAWGLSHSSGYVDIHSAQAEG